MDSIENGDDSSSRARVEHDESSEPGLMSGVPNHGDRVTSKSSREQKE
jgi:hypothetical protein